MLEGKRIIVTGAGRGIGRAIALACAREKAVVGINYRSSEDTARALEREIAERYNGRARLLPFDVTRAEEVESAIGFFSEEEGRIDGLVNNAGSFRAGLFVSVPIEAIENQVAVNLRGPMHCIRAVLPAMITQREGTIINVGSVAAARPNRGQAAYAATKGALESLTRALAVEYARKGIRVHCLRPGPIDTAMLEKTRLLAEEEVLSRIPSRRLGKPDEVAELTVFLLSDEAHFITGATHTIDGGYLEG